MIIIHQPKMDPGCSRRADHCCGPARHLDEHRVEERVVDYPEPPGHKITGKVRGTIMDRCSDLQ
jgi:hypothetical protein